MVEERADVTDLCTPDMQAFLLGCSFSWESALESKGGLRMFVRVSRVNADFQGQQV